MKRLWIPLLLARVIPVVAEQTVTVKGSDTMVILNQRWAEKYMDGKKGVVVQVTGGGSGTGIAALMAGATDICASSRPMKEKERAALQAKTGRPPVEIPVAKDGIAIFLNTANPVQELTLDQIALIYRGKLTNWKDVGGLDQKIILYSRENNSGTYEFFKDHVLRKKDFTPFAQCLPGTASVANAVARDARGIGYGGAAYAKGIRFCAVQSTGTAPGILPEKDLILSGAYPISRYLYFYLREPPSGPVQDFLSFVTSAEGQAIIIQVGYFPLSAVTTRP